MTGRRSMRGGGRWGSAARALKPVGDTGRARLGGFEEHIELAFRH